LFRIPRGVVVIKDHEHDGIELLEVIADRRMFPSMIGIARIMTARLQRNQLFGWFTPEAMRWCTGSGEVTEDTDIVIPGSSCDDPKYAQSIKGNWWLMGGDSDLR